MSTDFVYNNARAAFATGALNWTTAAINAALVNSSYGPLPTDRYLSSIPPGAMVARDAPLTGLAQTNGVCYGLIPTFNELINASPVVALVLYVKGTLDSNSLLVYYSSGGLGFPFTPTGNNYSVTYDSANGGFFQA